jgi:putative FmdB family regulatory protein
MPIYEYQCGACGHRLEAMQKMSESPLLDCPGCGQPALRKLVSAAGFQLKGGGWYVTDFKDGGKKKPEEGAKPAVKETAPASKSADVATPGNDGSKSTNTSDS